MNAYEAAKRLYAISEELTVLADKLGNAVRIDERKRVEKSIDALEVEFFGLKHRMERATVMGAAS